MNNDLTIVVINSGKVVSISRRAVWKPRRFLFFLCALE